MDKQTEMLNKLLQMFDKQSEMLDKQSITLNKILVSSHMSKIRNLWSTETFFKFILGTSTKNKIIDVDVFVY
jgi:hypothetical protein